MNINEPRQRHAPRVLATCQGFWHAGRGRKSIPIRPDVECHGVLTLVFSLIWIDMVLSDYCDYRLCDLEFCSNAGDDQSHALGYTQTQTKSVHT